MVKFGVGKRRKSEYLDLVLGKGESQNIYVV